MAGSPYVFDNELFTSFMYYATLLLVKTMIMTSLTSWFRVARESFCSIEDARVAAPNDLEKQKRLLLPSEDVERVRIVVFCQYTHCHNYLVGTSGAR